MGVQVAKGQFLYPPKRLFPDILNHVVYNLIVADIHNPLGKGRQRDYNSHLL